MGVIVIGMDYPKHCFRCRLKHSGISDYCTIEDRGFDDEDFDDLERDDWHPDWCPLRPLPEKHGRLIDADDYAVEMKERQANAMLWKEKAARNNDMTTFARGDQAMRTFFEAKLTLDNMETIVEAEGEK